MKISIKQTDLKAVSLAMSQKDIRYYLMGVNIEHNGQETRLVATDGHRLHAVVIENGGETLVDPVSFIMPLDLVKKCVSAKANRQDREPRIEIDYDQGRITATLPDGSQVSQMATDGRFPDYTRRIPRSESITAPEAAHFNPEYVADAIKGYAIFMGLSGKNTPSLGLNPQGSRAGFLSANGFTAVVMPMRGELSGNPDVRLSMPIKSPVKLQAVA